MSKIEKYKLGVLLISTGSDAVNKLRPGLENIATVFRAISVPEADSILRHANIDLIIIDESAMTLPELSSLRGFRCFILLERANDELLAKKYYDHASDGETDAREWAFTILSMISDSGVDRAPRQELWNCYEKLEYDFGLSKLDVLQFLDPTSGKSGEILNKMLDAVRRRMGLDDLG